MKLQCDVCGGEEASVFCCADEAALCDACDRRVHRANKLAGKHHRFSLLHPTSPSLAPRCDLCQEKRAFVFCQEDRAILCIDCDGSIHTANDLTRKHNRFLLTGVKLSPAATDAVAEEEGETRKEKKVEKQTADPVTTKSVKSCNQGFKSSRGSVITSDKDETVTPALEVACVDGSSSSSISDYLMNTLPGWRVDDLLLDYPSPTFSPASTFAFPTLSSPALCKMGIGGDDLLPFAEADLDSGGGTRYGDSPIWWVPRVPQVLPETTTHADATAATVGQNSWRSDDGFTVPQIVFQPSPSNKRSRGLCRA